MRRSDDLRPLHGFVRLQMARCLAVSFCVMVLLTATCAEAMADRPTAADNSTLVYFPPIGQQEIGDCTCWSSCYYYNTYTQARDEGLDASNGDPEVICSPRFMFALIAEGWWGAECTRHAMARLSDIGCAPVSEHAMSVGYTSWPTEAAWIAALRNRTGPLHEVRADTVAGLETVRQHIADGGCAVTRADFLSNYGNYGSTATGPGISNRVMYRRDGWHYIRHSICIVGYDDNRWYVDDRDGQTHYGAFLIANSEGPNWGWYNSTMTGTKGFIWVAYTMFLEQECGWYDYNLDVSPCFDNAPYPEVYFHDDRPHYRPKLYAVAEIIHNARNMLTLSGGIGPTSAPEFTGPNAIEYTDEGAIPISRSRRIAVDLTDGISLIPAGTAKNVFASLTVDASALSSGTITNADFHCDFNGNEVYRNVPAETALPVTVPPGTTGYACASVINPVPGDIDTDFDVDFADFASFTNCLTGPDVGLTTGCDLADLGGDADVDLDDFAQFQQQFTGP